MLLCCSTGYVKSSIATAFNLLGKKKKGDLTAWRVFRDSKPEMRSQELIRRSTVLWPAADMTTVVTVRASETSIKLRSLGNDHIFSTWKFDVLFGETFLVIYVGIPEAIWSCCSSPKNMEYSGSTRVPSVKKKSEIMVVSIQKPYFWWSRYFLMLHRETAASVSI